MKFGPVPVRDALGAIAAHSIRATARPYALQLDYKIAKGTELTAGHIEDLIEEGHSEIVVARLEPGDVHENDAALRLAPQLVRGVLRELMLHIQRLVSACHASMAIRRVRRVPRRR